MSAADTALALARAVDGERVLARLRELATLNAGAPGVSRFGYTDLERAAMARVQGWAEAAGATASWDEWGNLFLLRPGAEPDLPVALAGSHLDSVPHGGIYDGPLGVIGALEALAVAHEAGHRPRRGMELVAWTCEEPVRFAQGRVGSQLHGGRVRPADLVVADAGFDITAWTGANAPEPRRPARQLHGYLELHIEQGRTLEDANADVGIVTGIAGSHRLVVEIAGRADHSGATPMGLRHDALCAAAELILHLETAGRAEAGNTTVATIGRLEVEPNAVNVVPGTVRLLPDIRSLDRASSARVVAGLHVAAAEVAARRGVEIRVTERGGGQPTPFSAAMIDLVEGATRDLGINALRLPSGAGHDGQSIAHLAPLGMVFVPSQGGISHAPDEFTSDRHCLLGAQTLALAWLRLAQ